LHASRLVFTHPTSDESISLDAPLPADFVELLQALEQDSEA
jgi:hypothetical protein